MFSYAYCVSCVVHMNENLVYPRKFHLSLCFWQRPSNDVTFKICIWLFDIWLQRVNQAPCKRILKSTECILYHFLYSLFTIWHEYGSTDIPNQFYHHVIMCTVYLYSQRLQVLFSDLEIPWISLKCIGIIDFWLKHRFIIFCPISSVLPCQDAAM